MARNSTEAGSKISQQLRAEMLLPPANYLVGDETSLPPAGYPVSLPHPVSLPNPAPHTRIKNVHELCTSDGVANHSDLVGDARRGGPIKLEGDFIKKEGAPIKREAWGMGNPPRVPVAAHGIVSQEAEPWVLSGVDDPVDHRRNTPTQEPPPHRDAMKETASVSSVGPSVSTSTAPGPRSNRSDRLDRL